MDTPREDMKSIAEHFYDYWLDLCEAVDLEKWDEVDLICRKVKADVMTMQDLAYELKTKKVGT